MIPYSVDMALMAPEIFLSGAAFVFLILGAFLGNRSTGLIMVLCILALIFTGLEVVTEPKLWPRTLAFHGFFVTDMFAVTFKAMCLFGLALALMISFSAICRDMMRRFEYPVLVLLSGIGMMVMLSAHHFMSLYVGLELSALSLYVLAAFRRESVISAEAGMKYFILGALSSGMLLFGISLIYGFTGTLDFARLAALPAEGFAGQNGVIVGMVFVLAGLAFKISAVPFHMWTPDVYQGAPASVTALFAMVPKIAAVGLLVRLLTGPFVSIHDSFGPIVLFMAVASMIWGSVAAIAQTNIKRLLAYASIANIGYALLGIVAGTPQGMSATILYMGVYLLMTAGVFAVLLGLCRDDQQAEQIEDLAGLSQTHPLMAYTLAAILFAMAGIPPFAGFFSKLVVFQALVAAGYFGVAILGIVASVVAAYYYLKIIRVMFFSRPGGRPIEAQMDGGQQLVALFSILFVLVFALTPQTSYNIASRAADSLPQVTAHVQTSPASSH